MTKEQAIIELINGKKIKYRYFMKNEYIYMKNELYYNQDNILLDNQEFNFWTDRSSIEWEIGWSVYSK